jgi:dipeptidyl-peptidase-4
MLPALTKALLRHYGFRSYYYGNFASEASLTQDIFRGEAKGEPKEPKIWRAFSPQPRVGFNYVGLRNRLYILSEAYSYLDFRRRIAVTEAFVTEILKYSAANGAEIRRLTSQADARTIALGRNDKERRIGVQYVPKALRKPVPILVGEVVKKTNALSGHEMTAMVEDAVTPVKMLDYGLFAAARSVPIARAYLIPRKEELGAIAEKLRAHGIVVEELARPLTTEVDTFTVEKVTRAPRRIQGHDNVKVRWKSEEKKMRFEPGTYLVRTSQPLGLLAAYLLEPESDDGLVSWNFLDPFLEPQKVLPVYKLMRTDDLDRVETRSSKSAESPKREIQNH